MIKLSIEDIKTLKNLDLRKLNHYIFYLQELYCEVDRISINDIAKEKQKYVLSVNKNAKWFYVYPVVC